MQRGTFKPGFGGCLFAAGVIFIGIGSTMSGLHNMQQDEAIKALTVQVEALTAEVAELRAAGECCPEGATE